MKKMTFLFLLLLCGILFGCKLPEVETKENPLESVLLERITVDYDSPEQLIEQMFSAIQTGDVDAFRALFAVDVQNADPELDEQIREAFDFFDGALRSYEKKAGPQHIQQLRPRDAEALLRGVVHFSDCNRSEILRCGAGLYGL